MASSERRFSLAVGQPWHDYTLLEPLGSGGFSEVWAAQDNGHHEGPHEGQDTAGQDTAGQRVCVKVLFFPKDLEQAQRDRMVQSEATATTRIDHAHVAKLYGSGTYDGTTYFVYELLSGASLAEILATRTGQPLGPAQVLCIGLAVARGLGAAHALGILHRDIKPGNIFVSSAAEVPIKVLDFGAARVESIARKKEWTRVGTEGYVSPEQALGKPLDARSDLFALGVVLFQALCRVHPYAQDEEGTEFQNLLGGRRTRWLPTDGDIPLSLSQFIDRLLAPKLDDRPPDGNAAAAELQAIAGKLGRLDAEGLCAHAQQAANRRRVLMMEDASGEDDLPDSELHDGEDPGTFLSPPDGKPAANRRRSERDAKAETKGTEGQGGARIIDDTAQDDSGSDDPGSDDMGPEDTGSDDTSPDDSGPGDTGPDDTSPGDTGPEDTGPEDTGDRETEDADDSVRTRVAADAEPATFAAPSPYHVPTRVAPDSDPSTRVMEQAEADEYRALSVAAQPTEGMASPTRSTDHRAPGLLPSAAALLLIAGVAWTAWSPADARDATRVADKASMPETTVTTGVTGATGEPGASPELPVDPSPQPTDPQAAEGDTATGSAADTSPSEAQDTRAVADPKRSVRGARSLSRGSVKLSVGVLPGGKVSVDGGRWQPAPALVRVSPGKHRVVVRSGQVRAARTLLVPENTETHRVTIDLRDQ